MSPADEADKPKDEQEPKPQEPAEEQVVPVERPAPPVESMTGISIEEIPDLSGGPGRRILMLIVYFLMALAVAVLVVFGGRWLYKTITKKDQPATTNQPAGNNVPQQPSPTPTTPTTPTPRPAPTPSQTSQTSQLPNNGPGDIAAIFVGTAIAIGGLHYVISLRRSTN
ncbi:hypothetical protein A3F65_04230 [Candidatus Saccharibacteria bacterium RIFCSPHIGHO2_12_FULL_47_16b]|nr:MAG: hypothetical protein A3F65_04230 [Candidatus Saccharibacteria bacterium RIFCSPHIGHO2_12_FULL_47_16b]